MWILRGLIRRSWNGLIDLKNEKRGRISEYAREFGVSYYEGKAPWGLCPAEVALPCATQNEIGRSDARALIDNGCICLAEGANMPTEMDAVALFQESGVLFGPAKAANAGGVAVSGLEMAQNSMRLCWTRQEVDERLRKIMNDIHQNCLDTAAELGEEGDYVLGANVAGFRKVANAMIEQGVV